MAIVDKLKFGSSCKPKKRISKFPKTKEDFQVNEFNARLGGYFYCLICHHRHKNLKSSGALNCSNDFVLGILNAHYKNYPFDFDLLFPFSGEESRIAIYGKSFKNVHPIDKKLFPEVADKIHSIRLTRSTLSDTISFSTKDFLLNSEARQYVINKTDKLISDEFCQSFIGAFNKISNRRYGLYKKLISRRTPDYTLSLRDISDWETQYFTGEKIYIPKFDIDELGFDRRKRNYYIIAKISIDGKSLFRCKFFHNRKPEILEIIKGTVKNIPKVLKQLATMENYL